MLFPQEEWPSMAIVIFFMMGIMGIMGIMGVMGIMGTLYNENAALTTRLLDETWYLP